MFFPCFNSAVSACEANGSGIVREQEARIEREAEPDQAAVAGSVPRGMRVDQRGIRGDPDPETGGRIYPGGISEQS